MGNSPRRADMVGQCANSEEQSHMVHMILQRGHMTVAGNNLRNSNLTPSPAVAPSAGHSRMPPPQQGVYLGYGEFSQTCEHAHSL